MAASVAKHIPEYLKLYSEQLPEGPPKAAAGDRLRGLSRAFARATGWQLQCGLPSADEPLLSWSAPVNPGVGVSPGHLRIGLGPAVEEHEAIERSAAEQLATEIESLVAEAQKLRVELWRREAELATGVPVVCREDDSDHLAERLTAVLSGGAQAIGCQAAALYLLDDATTELKLRSGWNLPQDALLAPARPLRGAMADLEALTGHAVVLEDGATLEHWNIPHAFAAAVCVPLSTSATVLGTLWLYSNTTRTFSDHEVNIVEVVAGRLASDLERHVLRASGVQAKQLRREADDAARWLEQQLPGVAPLSDTWDLAGWTAPSDGFGGAMHDWLAADADGLAFAVLQAETPGASGMLLASSIRTAWRAHARANCVDALHRTGELIWSASPGDERASLCCGTLMSDGIASLAVAGDLGIWVAGCKTVMPLGLPSLAIGEQPTLAPFCWSSPLEAGEALIIASRAAREQLISAGAVLSESPLGRAVCQSGWRTAKQLLEALRSAIEATANASSGAACTLLVLRCRGPLTSRV